MLGDLTSDFKLRLFQLLFFFLHPTFTAPATRTQSAGEEVKPLEVCQFSAEKHKQQTEYQTQEPPGATLWQFSSFVFSDRLYTREGTKRRFPLWKGVNNILNAFQMEGRLDTCHCKQVEMLVSSESERHPVSSRSNRTHCFRCAGQVCIQNDRSPGPLCTNSPT